MGFYRGPRIVTNGLVMYLDAANSKSYPSTGTIWYDLSGNGNNGTLTNVPTYDNGSIFFDGINDYVLINNNLSSFTSITISTWLKPNDPSLAGPFVYFSSRLGADNGLALWISLNLLRARLNGVLLSTLGVLNGSSWINITYTWDGSINSIYLNGVHQVSDANTSLNLNGSNLNFSYGSEDGTLPFNGLISNSQIYNRALSASEILQNYNSQKSRFGLD